MLRLKSLLMTIPFLLAATGAFLLAGMLTTRVESPRLPFVYTTESVDNGFDLHVIDVLNGEHLFEVGTPQYDCPTSLSPDGRWLIYGQSNNEIWHQRYTLLDLQSGESRILSDNRVALDYVRWGDSYVNYVIRQKTSPYGDESQLITSYNLINGNFETISQRDYDIIDFIAHHWVDNELYTIVGIGEHFVVEHEDEDIFSMSPSLQGVIRVELSPGGRYIAYAWTTIVPLDTAYIIDLETGEQQSQEFNIFNSTIFWKPNSNTLTYLASENTLNLYNADKQEITSFHVEDNSGDIHWSPDGRYLAYRTYEDGITFGYVLDIETGESTQISQLVEETYWVDERYFMYNRYTSEYIETDDGRKPAPKDLWMYDVISRETIQLTNTPDIDENFQCSFG